MRKILHITIIIAVSLNLLHAPEGRKNSGKKPLRRIYIVRCCGKKSCLSVGKNINARNNSLFRIPETTAKSWGKTTFFTEVLSAIGNAGMVTEYTSAKQEQVAGETTTSDSLDSISVSTEIAKSEIPEAATGPTIPQNAIIDTSKAREENSTLAENSAVTSMATDFASSAADSTLDVTRSVLTQTIALNGQTKSPKSTSQFELPATVMLTTLMPLTTKLASTSGLLPLTTKATSTTTTTTCKPICGSISTVSCVSQPAKVKQMQLSQDSTEGRFLKSCGRKYFVSNTKINLTEAKKTCCAQKMRLLRITSTIEHRCVSSLNKILKQTAVSYWTGGLVDANCRFWCSDKGTNIPIVDGLNWLQTKTLHQSSANCLVFEMNVGDEIKSGLKFDDCSAKNLFICESRLFDTDGSLETPKIYGFWENGAGATFLYGNTLVTWIENWIQCLTLGMTPLSFVSKTELDFTFNLLKGWDKNYNYWTGGTRHDFATKGPIWCTSQLDISSVVFPLNDAGNVSLMGSHDCVGFQIEKITTNVTLAFRGTFEFRNCSHRRMFACRGPITTKPTCVRQDCPTKLARNPSLFNESTGFLKNAPSFGEWIIKCNKFFIIADATTDRTNITVQYTWDAARQRCESIGFRLISFESKSKFDCLVNVSQKNLAPFWTSGAYLDCKNGGMRYAWCGRNKFINMDEVIWSQGQPPEVKISTCISGVLDVDIGVQLQAVDCNSKLSYICEAENTKGESLANAKNRQCQQIFNVTESEVDSLLKKLDFTPNLKCYIKCMGESLELIDVNGATIDTEIIRLIQAAIANSNDVEKSFDVFDVCKQPTGVLGECEAGARLFKCGVEKAPAVVAAMVENAATDFPPAPFIGSEKDFCPFGLITCTQNTTLVNQVSNNIAPDGAGYYFSACERKYFVSSEKIEHSEPLVKCCEMGMTHAHFHTHDQFKCFLDADAVRNARRAGFMYSVSAYSTKLLPYFTWCPSKIPVDIAFKWGSQDSSDSKNFKCTYITPASQYGFQDVLTAKTCSAEMQYICMSM
ncbi:uncharacterized protein LOC135948142 [Cloeon dipterum]|uniref:uncharacterized protein LOC135948142 n=1 Tax=Cloeon dipterum TaxID=197152 RepID=UPI0032200936